MANPVFSEHDISMLTLDPSQEDMPMLLDQNNTGITLQPVVPKKLTTTKLSGSSEVQTPQGMIKKANQKDAELSGSPHCFSDAGHNDRGSTAKNVSQDSQKENIVPMTRDTPQLDLEARYIQRAMEYVSMLPGDPQTTAGAARTVTKQLHDIYSIEPKVDVQWVENEHARCASAIVNYCNKTLEKGNKSLSVGFVSRILKEKKGNYLYLITALIKQGAISLENIDDVVGLQTTILNILPKAEPKEDFSGQAKVEKMKKPKDAFKVKNAEPTREDPREGE